jgi:hydrogenase maturation factor
MCLAVPADVDEHEDEEDPCCLQPVAALSFSPS